jgi:hypothetical protein
MSTGIRIQLHITSTSAVLSRPLGPRGAVGLPVKIDAIFLSHPHNDHSDGLRWLLTAVKPTQFSGPFIMPDVSSPAFKAVKGTLNTLHFQFRTGGWNPAGTPGILRLYPEKEHILLYTRTREPPEDVDSDPVNKMSILMATDPESTLGKGAVFMTGDSVGHLILPHVQGQHLPVYKIQHHGSKRNSQIGKS